LRTVEGTVHSGRLDTDAKGRVGGQSLAALTGAAHRSHNSGSNAEELRLWLKRKRAARGMFRDGINRLT
jgi:hypothetical protein